MRVTVFQDTLLNFATVIIYPREIRVLLPHNLFVKE